jgi:hypothetical protein
MRSQDSSAVHDAITNAIDTILVMPDTAVRLAAFAYMKEQFLTRITRERNRAAYEARLQRSGLDLADIVGCKAHDIYRWSNTYAADNRLPTPRNLARASILDSVRIAHAAGVYRGDAVNLDGPPVVGQPVPPAP